MSVKIFSGAYRCKSTEVVIYTADQSLVCFSPLRIPTMHSTHPREDLVLTNAPLTSLEPSIRSQGKDHQGDRWEQECENHDRALARSRGELSNIPVWGSSSKEDRHQERDASAYTGSALKRKNGNTKRKDETRGRAVGKSRIPSPVSTNTIKNQQQDQRGRDDAAASHLLL